MIVTDGQGIPIGIQVESASTHESQLLHSTLDTISIGRKDKAGHPRKKPNRLIADKAYDSNDIRQNLRLRGIDPIIPSRSNNQKATHQDRRKQRRYKHRWKVERTISWLQNCRRLVVRYERYWDHWLSLIYMACIMIILNRVIS